jgi:putative ABC transport system permease protein
VFACSALLLGLAMTVTALVMMGPAALDSKALRDVGKVNLVVAGKGSPLQWVLASLYHVDIPPSNVSLLAVQTLLNQAPIKDQIANQAMMAMGDSVNGARIIGLDSLPNYLAFFDGQLAQGVLSNQAMQATLGAAAAQRLKLTIGSQFYSSHGLEAGGSSHDDTPYVVTAILKPTDTVVDSLVLTPIESIWLSHEGKPRDAQEAQILAEARDITAVLIQYRFPLSALTLPSLLDAQAPVGVSVVAVAPQLQRLWQLFEPFFQLLLALSILIALSSGLGVMLSARLTQAQRLRDLGILRMLGVSLRKLCALLVLDALILWLAAVGLTFALFVLAYTALNQFSPMPLNTAWAIAAPVVAMVSSIGLGLVLLNAGLTAFKLLKQSPIQVMQSR